VPLQEAFVRMQSTKGLAKAVSSEMADSLKSQEEVLTLALTKAQKDNNTVYLERVPAFAGASRSQPSYVADVGGMYVLPALLLLLLLCLGKS
jgi:hypothetical protein